MSSRNFNAYITSDPVQPEQADIAWLMGNLSPEHAEKLQTISDHVGELFAPEKLDDETLLKTTASCVDFYTNLYATDTERMLLYLGVNEENTEALGSSPNHQTSGFYNRTTYQAKPKPGTAFGAMHEAMRNEFRSVGADDNEMDDTTQKLSDDYTGFRDALSDELSERLGRFVFTAQSFGNPEVLRAEGQDAGNQMLLTLVEEIEKLGARPDQDSVARRIGKVLFGDKTTGLTRTEYDAIVTRKLESFALRTPEQLLEKYVRSAVLNYAEAVYGSTEFVTINNPQYLYDRFGSTVRRRPLRPLLPSEVVDAAVDENIGAMLYGNSQWSQKFRNFSSRNKWRQRERAQRERIFNSYQPGPNVRATVKLDPEEAKLEAMIAGLDAEKRKVVTSMSQLIGTISDRNMSYSFKKLIPRFKLDFVGRLSRTEVAQVLNINSIIKSAMVELHPDKNPEQEDAEQLFKFYSMIREINSTN